MEHRLRRSARVLLFDQGSGDVLLIRFEALLNGSPFRFWVTPGGEVEADEEERAAADRELWEELGLRLALRGPVHRDTGSTYIHMGETVRNDDVFFAATCERSEPKLAGVTAEEISLMREVRWWSRGELEGTTEKIFPVELARLVDAVWRERGWGV